ncbi:unnamed protein product [Adineta ricciae]|uniref:Carrier domain-containing protein n=1 Tax=Adineta ricciae TaxID=249248 RepID=A0A816BXF9_ADIRI|nr:unnamed protein product [Adineta ricciae]
MSCTSNNAHIPEILGALLVGSAVIMLHPQGNKDIIYISNVLQQKQVSYMQTVPEYLKYILEFVLKYDCLKFNTLRKINIRNNINTIQSIEKLYNNLCKNVHMWTSYGSTETAIDFIYPLPNYKCIILDEFLQSVTTGQIGELFVRGAGTFAAYLGHNDLTKRVFVDIDHELFFRTGDLARMDNKGLLYYKAKKDHQSKLHGHYIDLSEIEQCLFEHTFVSACVVIILDDNCLVAYIQSSDIDENQLRERCQSRLPSHMIPSVFVILEQLPLNENGKIDRKLLPKHPLSAMMNVNQSNLLVLTPLEKSLRCIFSKVFNNELLDVNTPFGEIGGTSLNVLHMIRLIRYQIGVEIDPNLVFNYPSVRQLAHAIKPLLSLNDELSIISETSSSTVDLFV